ncbi:MAG: hypothetical protein A2W00_13975 [Candidatus Eisenbacteria bacterium RBG_16_71_46]|nr:MAG: hypothetical protein A2W00_13975 [Candidatus Eisenbacteria bacterium RBG_16_71_46]
MSRLLPAVIGLCAVLAALAPARGAPSRAPRNLLANPGFEQVLPGHPWMPAGWDSSVSGMPTVFFGRDTFMAHGGGYAASVANVSTILPMAHNWNQSLLIGPEAWGKDLVLSVWTRNNGVDGRGYIMLQAYRDTVSKMAKVWGIPRQEAAQRLNIKMLDDPLIDLGWQRRYFSDDNTDWVRRDLRVFVAPSTDIVFVRCGLLGTGQVMFDDASLTLEPARPPDPLPLRTNLIRDPGFEGAGDDWEYGLPPFENLVIARDTTVAHSGKASIRMEGGLSSMVQARAGVCQVFPNRDFAGKRVRLSAWVKTDSLQGLAYIKIYCHALDGVHHDPTPRQFSANTDWTLTSMESDVPPGTYEIWAWVCYNSPAAGRLYYDDVSLEVLGPASKAASGGP